MRRLGLDAAQIRYVIVTHGHGDHYGGAQMIADRYRARIVASEIDWKMMETGLEFDSTHWDRPPRRDIAVKDGDTLTLGDTTVRFMITPGHTLGTISPVFEVRDRGTVHKALIWGGTSFNFGRDMGRLDSYIAQTERLRQLSAQWGIDVPLSNHSGVDGTVAKLKARADAPTGANPFVSGQPVVDRALRVLNACARAQRERFLIPAMAGASPHDGGIGPVAARPDAQSLDWTAVSTAVSRRGRGWGPRRLVGAGPSAGRAVALKCVPSVFECMRREPFSSIMAARPQRGPKACTMAGSAPASA